MKPHKFLLLAAAAAVVAERAEPTAHFILLATQRTGSTWVMSELSKHSSCIATGTELFLDHKGFTWTESSRVRCLKTLYGSDVDKKQKPHKCSPKFKQFRSEVRAFAARQNRSSLPAVVGWKYLLNAGVPKHKSNIGGMMRDWPWLKRMWKHRGARPRPGVPDARGEFRDGVTPRRRQGFVSATAEPPRDRRLALRGNQI